VVKYLPRVIIERLELDPTEFSTATGWDLKPEGACKGDRCVPIPRDAPDGLVDVRVLAERLGMALVEDARHRLWALGPEAGGRVLSSAQMPELELPDRHGRAFSLRSLRGTRIVMVAWASW
jgi:hypothetical protein